MTLETAHVAIRLGSLDKEEIFTHVMEGVSRHFPIRIMYETAMQYGGRCLEIRTALIPLKKSNERFIKANMGIEKWRIKRLEGEYLERPLIAIEWDCGKITIIDGNHRYIKLRWLGRESAKCFIFKRVVWEQFCLPGFEPMQREDLPQYSRMREYEQWKEKNSHEPVKIERIA